MVEIKIPGGKELKIEHIVLDMNGTIAVDGVVSSIIQDRIKLLTESFKVHIITADTHGKMKKLPESIKILCTKLIPENEPRQKAEFVQALGATQSAAIGNGANDVEMLKTAALAIAVIGQEGCTRQCLEVSDIVVTNPEAALDLLLHPNRLMATLRK